MKLNFLDKKSLTFFVGAGAGYIGGNVITEQGLIPKIDENQELIEGGVKVLAGLYLYKKGKVQSLMQGAGVGLGVNGLVDFYQYYEIQQALKNSDTEVETNGQNASLAKQSASLAYQDYGTDGNDQSFSDGTYN